MHNTFPSLFLISFSSHLEVLLCIIFVNYNAPGSIATLIFPLGLTNPDVGNTFILK